MKPVFQDRFGYPMGNCWEACLASLLEVPLEVIPDGRTEGGSRGSWQEMNQWLIENFHVSLCCIYHDGLCWPVGPRDQHYMLGGTTEGGIAHAVVAKGGRVVHNPNPKPGSDLVSVSMVEFIVPVTRVAGMRFSPEPTDEQMAEVMAQREKEAAS